MAMEVGSNRTDVAAHRGKRGRGRVVIWRRRVWSDGCAEVRMSAAAGQR